MRSPFLVLRPTYPSLEAAGPVSSRAVNPLIAIPIKPFGVAKSRLRSKLNASQRSLLGKSIAGHTVGIAQRTGARVAVVTADDGVAVWAEDLGADVIREAPANGTGLNGAAGAAVARATELGTEWVILHADLPLLTTADLDAAFDLFQPDGYVLSPSYNGGTSLFVGKGPVAFSYGPGSFQRHLASTAGRAAALVRTGLALDLDTPQDLEAMERLGVTTTWHSIPG